MEHASAHKTYRQTGIETADAATLVIMCYDAVIEDLREAARLHGERAFEAMYERVRHAQDLMTELLAGLDHERGGEIAANLARLYNFTLRELIGLNAGRSPAVLVRLSHILSELRGAWESVRAGGARRDLAAPRGAALRLSA